MKKLHELDYPTRDELKEFLELDASDPDAMKALLQKNRAKRRGASVEFEKETPDTARRNS